MSSQHHSSIWSLNRMVRKGTGRSFGRSWPRMNSCSITERRHRHGTELCKQRLERRGFNRRDFLQWGAPLLGLGLADLLRARAAAAESVSSSGSPLKKSLIVFWTHGGMSQQDTYDLKPSAPAEFRGIYQPIATAAPELRLPSGFRARRRLWIGSRSSVPSITVTAFMLLPPIGCRPAISARRWLETHLRSRLSAPSFRVRSAPVLADARLRDSS